MLRLTAQHDKENQPDWTFYRHILQKASKYSQSGHRRPSKPDISELKTPANCGKKGKKNDSKSGMVLMAVRFILGRSGTGKTSYCIKAIADALSEPADNQPLLLLVPEQATYQAERAILADKKLAGYNFCCWARTQPGPPFRTSAGK